MEPLTTRYAPSPTGRMHLGHVAHLIYVWGIAERLGAQVLLRMEDHDRDRCRPAYEESILEDLEWLGFRGENELSADYRQSDCDEVFDQALTRLSGVGEVYRCECSRKEIAGRSPIGVGGERRYSGFCRGRNVPDGVEHGLRLALDPGAEEFEDLALGRQAQDPSRQCGDLLLRDRNGNWTYQFAVTVDDMRHGVNLVIRGEDLLESTGRQIRLARMLGREKPPRFVHHPLIRDAEGDKLSKKAASAPVRELRSAGVPAEETLGRAAFAVGLIPREQALARCRLAELPLLPTDRSPAARGS